MLKNCNCWTVSSMAIKYGSRITLSMYFTFVKEQNSIESTSKSSILSAWFGNDWWGQCRRRDWISFESNSIAITRSYRYNQHLTIKTLKHFQDYWAIMHSMSRQQLFVSYPSLNTAVNKRTKLFAHHQIKLLADECIETFSNYNYLEKHLILNTNSESGISLRRLLALQITIVKIPE